MIESSLRKHRILIVGGSGGVGKTSVSAAIGLAAARAGYRTLVLTIDPARRLAAALGLDDIGSEAKDVTVNLGHAGASMSGELHAMMLDVRNTLDQAVDRYAPTPDRRDQILNNKMYQNIAGRLSGSQEYAAMQQLEAIASQGDFDRIILDTPPTTQALDFLTAPERLQAFFDSNLIRVFLSFSGKAGRGFFKVTDVLFRTLERLTGAQVIKDITEFFEVADSILQPFSAQAARAQRLLRDPRTAFVIVTGANPHQLEDASNFSDTLKSMGIRMSNIVVNRWRVPIAADAPEVPEAIASKELDERVAYWAAALEQLAHLQTQAIEELSARSDPASVICVPEMTESIHSLEGLCSLSDRLLDADRVD
ncbi:MAG: ArsA-related P-loop ATPase [Wenzhouxiangella sp.]|jgi:anion-transporting  ArsA/GET3 family ATPase|nr:ArsA-related P-loop ATPase [Wenzhouxiangella sp.]